MRDLAPLLEAAKKLQPEVTALRRAIHQEPELGLENPATRARVLAQLGGLPLEINTHSKSSGVVATLRGARPGRRILLRADTDALPMPEDNDLPFRSQRPGAMHACGHDAHTAMLAGAARLLCAQRDSIDGEVVFVFQPGEEGFAGAQVMLDEGLPEADGAFAIHITPLLPSGMIGSRPGALLASADFFGVTVEGKGGHASMPHDCRDPIPAACEITTALQTFVTREIPVADPAVITVTRIAGGTTGNVIPERVELQGTIRALSERARAKAHAGLERVARGIAQAHGVEANVALQRGYPVTVNDAEFEAFSRSVAHELLGPRGVIEFGAPIMGAEDFSYVLQRTPGAMVFLGLRPPGVAEPAPCHSNRMQIDEDGMAYGVALHAAIALRFLGAPLRDARAPADRGRGSARAARARARARPRRVRRAPGSGRDRGRRAAAGVRERACGSPTWGARAIERGERSGACSDRRGGRRADPRLPGSAGARGAP
jgi:hippurate hydrolase